MGIPSRQALEKFHLVCCGVQNGVLVDAIHSYVGSGPALTDEERRAVRVALRLHEPYGESRALESTLDDHH